MTGASEGRGESEASDASAPRAASGASKGRRRESEASDASAPRAASGASRGRSWFLHALEALLRGLGRGHRDPAFLAAQRRTHHQGSILATDLALRLAKVHQVLERSHAATHFHALGLDQEALAFVAAQQLPFGLGRKRGGGENREQKTG